MVKEPVKDVDGLFIVLLKQGDAQAFAQFVRQYQDMVFACCRAVGLSDNDIEDAAADTFLAAWQAIAKFNENSKLSSWLWSIAYHKAIDHRRKRTAAGSLDESIESVSKPQTSTQESIETDEQSNRLWKAVQRLALPQAAVIVLFYREEKSIEDIARILEIPQNTVKTNLHRGRKELYNQLHSIWESEYVRH